MAHAHDPHELFPRQEVAAAVAEAQVRQDRRDVVVTWVLAAGLGLLALGLPDPRIVGDMALVRAATEGGAVTITPVVVRGLAWLTRTTHEQSAFLVGGLSWALLLPALRTLLLTVGFTRREALLLAVVGALSPTAFVGGTLPLDHAPGMLGATLLAATLFRTAQGRPWGYQWRVTLVLFAAILLRFENVLLVPAAAVALSEQGRARGLPWALPPTCLALVLVVSLTILVGDLGWSALGQDLLAGAEPSFGHFVGWMVRMAIGLGGLSVGIFGLLLGRRDPEEAPPPWWVVPWCLAALVPIVGGDPAVGPTAGYLVPLGVLGLADLRVRTRHPERLMRTGALLLGVQIGLTAGLRIQTPDPDRAWRETAREELRAGDALWTGDRGHRYLVRYRWAGSEVSLREPAATAPPPPGGRAVLDGVGAPPLEGMLRLVPGRGLEPATGTGDDG